MSFASILTWIKMAVGVACGIATALFGGMDAVFCVLLIFIALDYITGIIVAVCTKTVSSAVGFRGLMKKIVILVVIAVAHLVGQAMGIGEVRSFIIGFYIANEGISILENAAKVGVPLPKKLLAVLEQLKQGGDEETGSAAQ